MKSNLLRAGLIAGLAFPTTAMAELSASGSVMLGFMDSDAGGEAFIHSDINTKAETEAGATKLGFSLDLDVDFTDNDENTFDASFDDLTIYADFGAGGKLEFTTEDRCYAGGVPWIDGDLVGANTDPSGYTDSVHTQVGGRMRCVGYNPVIVDPAIQPAPFAANTDGYFKYSNKIGEFQGTLYFDPFQTATGEIDAAGSYDADQTITDMAQWEIELDYKIGPMIARVQYNDLEDINLWAIFPLMKQGIFAFVRYEEQMDNPSPDNYRWTGFVNWRSKNTGMFKGITAIYQADDDQDGYVLQGNFGDQAWNASVAVDMNGDFAVEGKYNIDDNSALMFGYDSGCDTGDCFNANAGFGGAAAQGESFSIAYSLTF